MDRKTIYLPHRIISNYIGYSELINIYWQLKKISNTEIIIDFSYCSWFEANLTAVLGAIFDIVCENNNSINISNLEGRIKNILNRNSFLKQFGIPDIKDHNKTTIPYQEFSQEKGPGFKDYIREKLLQKENFPDLSILAEKKINESIFELFENAYTHGACKNIHTCGQYFPNKKPARIDMTIVDMGQTIKTNVNRFRKKFGKEVLSGSQAIEWALIKGNTTKTGDNPGGLGLDVIFEFIKLNNGKVQIVSADGYWEFRKGKTEAKLFDNNFPGTIANIEFNLDDNSYYQLKSEVSLDNIF